MEKFNSADILKKQNVKKRFTTLEVGLFEISFVLIIIILLFGTLNYFNILSLSSLYPNQLGFLPHKPFNSSPVSKVQLANYPSVNVLSQLNSVSAASDLSDYTLLITDKKALIAYIGNFNIWGRSYNEEANQTVLRKIIFRLSDTEGRINNLTKEPNGSSVFSSEYFSTKDTLEISIYINPKELDSASRSDVFDKAAIANIYHISLFTPISEDIETKDIMSLYEGRDRTKTHYFTVLKNEN